MNQKSANPVLPEPEPAPPLDSQIYTEALKLHYASEFDKAETLYRATLILNPTNAEAHYHLGLLFHTQQRLEEAVVAYRDTIFARLDYAEAYANMGAVMKDLGKPEEAEIFYRQAIAYAPYGASTHNNLGVLYNELRRTDEARTEFRRAISVSPEYEWSYINMAPALLDGGDARASIEACQRAMKMQPDLPIGQFNLGASLKALNRLDEATECFRTAVRLQPEFGEAHFALGQVLLMQGEYEEGWREYDWRWKLPEYRWLSNIHGEFTQPRWQGEPIAGKTLLIYGEQGLGDVIQHVRYIPQIVAKGAKVILAVHPPVLPLFTNLEGVTTVPMDAALPPFDLHCPLLGMPEIFGTRVDTVPATVPYVTADPAKVKKWKERIGDKGFKVGIVWAGNPTQRGDRWRSPRLAAMAPLFDVPGVTFVALQMGAGREDIEQHPLPASVIDLGEEIRDFADTAAIMMGLDLVITSCTAPLHLAGALGVPTWAVIPYSPHFLWLLGRTDSPWYPTLTLYRQDRPGADWSVTMKKVAADLTALAAE